MTPSVADRERWRRVAAVLDEALELPAGEVAAYLDRACAGDPALRAEVEGLLAAERDAGAFLETPARDLAAPLLDDLGPPSGDAEIDRRLGPYRIVRRIASGGMGVVYEAWDERLRRPVAVKLLPADWSSDPAAKERFLREARAASALDHPNICTLHDLGESGDGRLYLVMTYYAGETLRDVLERGPLPVEQARDLAAQVARGLARAHAAGIVHRDVKPPNVIVAEGGQAKILDFGIAKISGDASSLTRAGHPLGTPAYMSPEQVTGEGVDERTDVWSLGVILYEMLAGRRPFQGGNDQAVLYGILSREPAPLTELRPEVPPGLARVVEKALAKEPAKRYQSMAELLAELDPPTAPTAPTTLLPPRRRRRRPALAAAAAVLAVLALGVAGWLWRDGGGRGGASPAAPAAPVVGVMPFVNRTGDAALDWYGEGIARLVSDDLSASRHLHLVSAQRLEPLRAAADPAALARQASAAGIEVLLTGELLPGADGLTVAARLDESAGGRQLAARRVDGLAPEELLATADQIARAARKGLGVPPTETVDVFAADFATDFPEAYGAYVEGLRALTGYRFDAAERAFSEALRLAPSFTMARYRLAQVLDAVGRTDEALRQIRRASAQADRLADRDRRYVRAAEAYLARRSEEAVAAYREIVARYPYETEARFLLAIMLHKTRRYEEELAVLAELAELEPENHITWSLSGGANLELGNFNQAVLDLRRFIALEPDSANGHHSLGDAYRYQGELELAAAEYAEALRRDPSFHYAAVSLGVLDVLRGRWGEAEARLEAVAFDPEVLPRHRIDAVFELASLLRAGGRFNEAAEALAALAEPLAAEGVREALALTVRGLSRLELGEEVAAHRLLEQALARAPEGPATRYLFARGLLELQQGRYQELERTIAEILAGAEPIDNASRTVEKAAAYLRGTRWLAEGRSEQAILELSQAVSLKGFEYTVYRLALARAYLAAGRLPEALAAARQAEQERSYAAPRLDLELDRLRARLLLAEVQAAMGSHDDAAASAREFLARWQHADPGRPELRTAQRLAAGD